MLKLWRKNPDTQQWEVHKKIGCESQVYAWLIIVRSQEPHIEYTVSARMPDNEKIVSAIRKRA